MFDCPNLAVPMNVMQHVVRVESSGNPYAIGVVGGRLARQPRTLSEAVSTAQMLEQQGYNFSLGVSQVNRYNLAKYGLTSYAQAFQVCPNLQAGSRILKECYQRAGDWGKAFSCYYSGNFTTGYRHGYVQKVFASMARGQVAQNSFGGVAVQGNANRRVVARTSYPAYDQYSQAQAAQTSDNVAFNDPTPAAGAYSVSVNWGTKSTAASAQTSQMNNQVNQVSGDVGQATVTSMKESDAASLVDSRRHRDDAFVF
jgi:type IV secretion system protein VirB1